MFKRTNKITSLLVAIAAVVSIVPSTIANASEKVASASVINATDKSETTVVNATDKSATTVSNTVAPATAINASDKSVAYNIGWSKLANGTWNFYDATGTKVISNWVNFGGVWYYFKADGAMAIGWYQYLENWYYFNQSGAMLSNTVIDGYQLNAWGAYIK